MSEYIVDTTDMSAWRGGGEVVRCRDCKHMHLVSKACIKVMKCDRVDSMYLPKRDGYCSAGEKAGRAKSF